MSEKKTRIRYEEYKDHNTWQRKPISESWKEKLAQELREWAKNDPDAFKISQFYLDRGIGNADFYRWTESNDSLKAALADALEFLGNRREIGAMKRQLAEGIVTHSLARYDKQWYEYWRWREDVKAKSQAQAASGPTTIQVVMEDFNKPQKTPEEVAKGACRGMRYKATRKPSLRKKKQDLLEEGS